MTVLGLSAGTLQAASAVSVPRAAARRAQPPVPRVAKGCSTPPFWPPGTEGLPAGKAQGDAGQVQPHPGPEALRIRDQTPQVHSPYRSTRLRGRGFQRTAQSVVPRRGAGRRAVVGSQSPEGSGAEQAVRSALPPSVHPASRSFRGGRTSRAERRGVWFWELREPWCLPEVTSSWIWFWRTKVPSSRFFCGGPRRGLGSVPKTTLIHYVIRVCPAKP